MAVIYKTLFEVKLMHEYFLTRRDGTVIFQETAQPQRLTFLEQEFEDGRMSINQDIYYEFPEELKSSYEGLYLKLIPSYSGCRVVVRVTDERLADLSTVYRPFAPLPDDLSIFISVRKKNNNIYSYTNERIKRSCPAIYFFSTQDAITLRTFPYLTNAIPAEGDTSDYEQGELALSSGNTIREFFRDAGADQWNNVTGSGFINESDRLILPTKFQYSFGNNVSLTEAEFVLKDHTGVESDRILVTNSSGIGPKYFLDFSKKITTVPLSLAFIPSQFIHTLEVTGNNGYQAKHSILFSNELSATDSWAAICVSTRSVNDAFNLFAPDGFLIRRRDPIGTWTPAPVFEIPVKSRFAYWRFINDRGREMIISASLTDYVNKEGNVLVTKRPRSIARHWFLLQKESPVGTVYVPNPLSYEAKIDRDRRLLFDILVPQSVLFPLTV